jgi:hypothetical protein
VPYDDEKKTLLLDEEGNEISHNPVFECNQHCSCDESCPLRVVQLGIQFQLQVSIHKINRMLQLTHLGVQKQTERMVSKDIGKH